MLHDKPAPPPPNVPELGADRCKKLKSLSIASDHFTAEGLIGEYQTRELWMGNLAFLLFLISGTRLAMHPMWKKDKE